MASLNQIGGGGARSVRHEQMARRKSVAIPLALSSTIIALQCVLPFPDALFPLGISLSEHPEVMPAWQPTAALLHRPAEEKYGVQPRLPVNQRLGESRMIYAAVWFALPAK
jgi:hypothetical protein